MPVIGGSQRPAPRVLALDMATRTGWALCVDGVVSSGAIRFGDDLGEAAHAFETWLKAFVAKEAIHHIAVEAAVPVRGKTNLRALMRAHGWQTLAAKVCFECGVALRSVNVGTWRKHFIGCARAPKSIGTPYRRRQWLKNAVIEECQRRGLSPASDDEADALGVLTYAMHIGGTDLAQDTAHLRLAA